MNFRRIIVQRYSHNTQLTWFWTSLGKLCPHSVFSRADAITDNASCAAWPISPFLRNTSSLLSSPFTRLFKLLETSSSEDWQRLSCDDGVTFQRRDVGRYSLKQTTANERQHYNDYNTIHKNVTKDVYPFSEPFQNILRNILSHFTMVSNF